MPQDRLDSIHNLVAKMMRERGYTQPFGDDDSLFASGRLDSMMAVDLILRLEQQFGVEFGQLDFDVSLIDSVRAIAELTMGAAAA